jgi:hypothetical protein
MLTPQNSWVALAEIEMRTTAGGTDATGSGAPIDPGAQAGDIDNLFDGNSSTFWGNASGSPVRVGYDFGTPIDIVEVALTTYNQAGEKLKYANVCYSDDAISWVDLGPTSGEVSGSYGTYVIGDFEPTVATFHDPDFKSLDTEWPARDNGGVLLRERKRYDAVDGGALSISGTVAIDDSPDIPVRRRVRLFEKKSGRFVRETWSAVDGSYSFTNLKDQEYFVLSHDHTNNYNAAIKDRITPE